MKTRTINNLNLEDVPLLKVGDEEIVSGQRYSAEKSFTNSGWHSHNMAVIGSIDSGLMGMRTQSESMVFSYGMIAFIPANLPHNEEGLGTEVIGWYLCLPKNRIGFMPNRICILESSELLLALCKRIVSWGEIKEKSETQKRLSWETHSDCFLHGKPRSQSSVFWFSNRMDQAVSSVDRSTRLKRNIIRRNSHR